MKGNNMGNSWKVSILDVGKDGWLTPPKDWKDEEETSEEEGEE